MALKSELPTLVDFWAPWCGPCRALAPTLEQVSAKVVGKARIVKMNIDDNQNTAEAMGIRSIPTLFVFKGGQKVGQIIGRVPQEVIEAELAKHVQ